MASAHTQHVGEQSSIYFVAIAKRLLIMVLVLIVALLFSIVIEWIGIWRWWPEQGLMHSQNMVQAELQFLSQATSVSPFNNPMGQVLVIIASLDRVFETTKLTTLLQSPIEIVTIATQSAINMARVFTLRLMVMLFSMPTFIVFGLVGITRGLVGRELRRWGGGRESSGMYHLYIKLLPETLIGLWFIYLSMPFTINPFYIIGPAAIVFGILVANTSYRLKKYL